MPDLIILGAGAAGLLCAIEAGKRGRKVLLLERNSEIGEKIRISGGGRCNFTNIVTTDEHYLSDNPHFCRSALSRYTPEDFIRLVEKHGIRYHEKKLGQLFCDESSRQIIDMLRKECAESGVEIRTGCSVNEVGKKERFFVRTDQGEFDSEALVVATGGLSIPKLGATDIGYRIAERFGIPVVPPRPGLVAMTFSADDLRFFGELSGISLDATVSCNGHSFRENILFTHRGLSGPAILQISSYWNPGDTIMIDLAPEHDLQRILKTNQQSDVELATILSVFLPKRFVRAWCDRFVPSRPMRSLSLRSLSALAEQVRSWKLVPSGTEGYGKAEVTCGGVDTRALSSKTMEAKNVPGLYFIGEVVDVTGHLGGYNFQWAWASGFVAGEYA